MLVIFDIDGTIIHTQIFEKNKIYIYRRPGLDELMEYVFNNFEVGFWTAATHKYANFVLEKCLKRDHYNKIKFIYSYDRCRRRYEITEETGLIPQTTISKPLRKIWRTRNAKLKGWTKRNTLIIEDTQSNCIENYGNAIYVPSYNAININDEILYDLTLYLEQIRVIDNVRVIDKRNWVKSLAQEITTNEGL